MSRRRFLLQVLGVTLVLTGAWWVLQGGGVIGDAERSFIVGDTRFLALGGLALLGGIVLLVRLGRR